MPAYAVEFRPAARKALRKLSRADQERIAPHIADLATNPRPPGSEKIAGRQHTYRVRVGTYRVLYEIHDAVLVVLVVAVAHRREVYR